MRILYDYQGAQTPGSSIRGIGRYTRELLKALAEIENSSSIDVLVNSSLMDCINAEDLSKNINVVRKQFRRRKKKLLNYQDRVHAENDKEFIDTIQELGSTHVIVPASMELDTDFHVSPLTYRLAPHAYSSVIVHDIIPYIFRDKYLFDELIYDKYMTFLRASLEADIVFTVSETTKSDLIKHLGADPRKICVIGAGVNFTRQVYSRDEISSFRQRLGINGRFILFSGGDEFRKNLVGAMKAFFMLGEEFSDCEILVCGHVSDAYWEKIKIDLSVSDTQLNRVRLCGYLSEEDLKIAYSTCAVTLAPSLYEGFGLNVIEAIALGSPVIAAGNSSMAEIISDKSLLFDPYNIGEIAEKLRYSLVNERNSENENTKINTILEYYSWKNVAARILKALSDLEYEKKGEQRKSRIKELSQRHLCFVGLKNVEKMNRILNVMQIRNPNVYIKSEEIKKFKHSTHLLRDLRYILVDLKKTSEVFVFVNECSEEDYRYLVGIEHHCRFIFISDVSPFESSFSNFTEELYAGECSIYSGMLYYIFEENFYIYRIVNINGNLNRVIIQIGQIMNL